jgi:hypothetical protein
MKNSAPPSLIRESGKKYMVRDSDGCSRREVICSNVQEWDKDVLDNVICPLTFPVTAKMQTDAYDVIKDLEFIQYSIINYASWPDSLPLNTIVPFFEHFADIARNPIICYNSPKEIVYPHHDVARGTSIYFPIWPSGNDYAPMEIYWNDKVFGLPPNNPPCMYAFNTQLLHAMFNNSFYRYNIQISIDMPYQEVKEKYNDVFKIPSI